jgi:hypothetical protein
LSALVLALALGLALPWSPAPAYADAVVTVQLKDPQGQPADGKVTLAGADGKPVASCSAQAGRCDMHGVAGGSYTVTVEPAKGAAPKPRKVMIPPIGNVSLLVATG